MLLLLLSCVAGYVDAVSFLDLSGVFTANMTGHAVLLGIGAVRGDGTHTLLGLASIAGFFAGAVLASFIVRTTAPGQAIWPRRVTLALALEGAVLLAEAIVWYRHVPESTGATAVCIAVTAFAMGMQGAAVRVLALGGISTTYITGTLTTIAADVVVSPRRRSTHDSAPTILLVAVWAVYVVGAIGGAALSSESKALEMAVPAVTVVIVAIIALCAFRIEEP